MATQDEVNALIAEHSTQKYNIEYKGPLSNHMTHGIIALYRLGATKSRLEEFANWYAKRLEPATKHDDDVTDPDSIAALLGKRDKYDVLFRFYSRLFRDKYDNNLNTFIEMEFSKMADGMHCAALHPMIYLGYALSIQNTRLVTEGMAYLHYSYQRTEPVPPRNATADLEILDALKLLKTSGLKEKSKEYRYSPDFMPDVTNPFLRSIAVPVEFPESRKIIFDIVRRIKFPDWFNPLSASVDDVVRLMRVIIHWALTVYGCDVTGNDFFILHGVTGAWGLHEILKYFTDPKKAFNCVQYFIATLFYVYVTQGCPEIDTTKLKTPPTGTLNDIKQEVIGKTMDEHIYKLVHVCNEMEKANEENHSDLYKVSCRNGIDNEFDYVS